MADESPPGGTFSSIAEGYGGAQQALARLGFLPGSGAGSFAPSDRNGAAIQFPTPPPPRFPTVVSTTLPFPAAAPQFMGAASPPTPSVLPPMFSAPQPTYTQGMPQANFGGGGGGGAMPPQASPFPFGVPMAAPNWTRSFTQPMQGFGSQGGLFAGGSVLSDSGFTGMLPSSIYTRDPGTGVNVTQNRMNAGLRMNNRMEEWGLSGLNIAATGAGMLGAYGMLRGAGAGLGGIMGAAGAVALPLQAAAMWAGSYQEERAGTHAIENTFSGMSMGGLASPTGRGINPVAARQIQNRFKQTTVGDPFFTKEDMFTTMNMAQDSGLMRGHTNSVEQVVTRVKELAKVTKSIMDLGEGITQQDAIELQAISQNMGISSKQFASQGIGAKLTAAARATGQTVSGLMTGAGASGASLYSQMGMNAGSGMLMGAHTSGMAASMVNSGNMSAREMAMLGGESGIQNMLIQGVAGSQARNAGNMTYGLLTGPNALQAMATGSLSFKDAYKQGRSIVNNAGWDSKQKGIASQFMEEMAPDMFNDAQEQLSPERQTLMFMSQANAMVRDSKGKKTAFTAFKELTGSSDSARALMKLANNPGAIRALEQQSAVAAREAAKKGADEYDEYNSVSKTFGRSWDSLGRGMKDMFGVDSSADAAAKSDYRAHAEAIGVDPDSYRYHAGNLGLNAASTKKLLTGNVTANLSEVLGRRGLNRDSVFGSASATDSGYKNDYAKKVARAGGYETGGNRFGQYVEALFEGVERSVDPYADGGFTEGLNDSLDSSIEKQDALIKFAAKDMKGSQEVFDEYARYNRSSDKDVAGRFLDSFVDRSGIGKAGGRVVYDTAMELAEGALSRPGSGLKVLGAENIDKTLRARLKAKNINLTEDQIETQKGNVSSVAGAHLSITGAAGGADSLKVSKLLAASEDSRGLSGGRADEASYFRSLYGALEDNDSRTVKDQAVLDATSTFAGTWDDEKDVNEKLLAFTDKLAGLGLTSEDEIAALLESGGTEAGVNRLGSRYDKVRGKLRGVLKGDTNSELKEQVAKMSAANARTDKAQGVTSGSSARWTASRMASAVQDFTSTKEGDDARDALSVFGGSAGFDGSKGADGLTQMQDKLTALATSGANSEELMRAAYGSQQGFATLDEGTQKIFTDMEFQGIGGGTQESREKIQGLVEKLQANAIETGVAAKKSGGGGDSVKTAGGSEVTAMTADVVKDIQQQNVMARESLSKLVGKTDTLVDKMEAFTGRVAKYMETAK